MLEPPVEGTWRTRPRQRLETVVDFPFAEPVQVNLVGARTSRVSADLVTVRVSDHFPTGVSARIARS